MKKTSYTDVYVNEFAEILKKYSENPDSKLFDLIVAKYRYAIMLREENVATLLKISDLCKEISNTAKNSAFIDGE
jgi:hypothetical protein